MPFGVIASILPNATSRTRLNAEAKVSAQDGVRHHSQQRPGLPVHRVGVRRGAVYDEFVAKVDAQRQGARRADGERLPATDCAHRLRPRISNVVRRSPRRIEAGTASGNDILTHCFARSALGRCEDVRNRYVPRRRRNPQVLQETIGTDRALVCEWRSAHVTDHSEDFARRLAARKLDRERS